MGYDVSMLNKSAPEFCLADQTGEKRSLKEYLGRWVVVYFYPHDNSLNCTKEACNFRDEYKIISQFGDAEIIGINQGSVASHKKFAERNNLDFPILSDPKHKVTSDYGAWRSNKPKLVDTFFGTRRNTYIINPKGVIVKMFESVDPNNHAQEVISALQKLQGKTSASHA